MRDADDDAARFDALFRAYHPTVRDYARRRAPAHAVDDVIAETFIVAWRRADRVPEDPVPWLLTVARNVIRDETRGQRRRARLLARVTTRRVEVDEELDWRDEESRGTASAAFARLADNERETLGLIAWEGLTPAQAAAVLGIPPGRFRVRLHRARRHLQQVMEQSPEETERSRAGAPTPNCSSEVIA